MESSALDDLLGIGPQRIYKDKYLNEISFPLGGIGTGSIGLAGNGSLKDFEIFNRPHLGSWFPKTFGIIRVKEQNKNPVCRILEGPKIGPYTPRDGGAYHCNGEGFPHMDSCEFSGEFPFARIKFKSKAIPLDVELEAYNPFIPSDEASSSYPVAILRYHVKNISNNSVAVSIIRSMLNLVGFRLGKNENMIFNATDTIQGKFLNEFREEENIKGIFFTRKEQNRESPDFGSLALTTSNENYNYTPYWPKSYWYAAIEEIWNSVKDSNSLPFRKRDVSNKAEAGALLISENLAPGESKIFSFYITWYFPNFEKYWRNMQFNRTDGKKITWKNYYASQFDDAFDVAVNFVNNEDQLYILTKKFHQALFSSTLPPFIIDAISSGMSILKTATCIRLTSGEFYGWEGTSINHGWCEGTCNHVWNYQQALSFLFPNLQRTIHDLNFAHNFINEDTGAMRFRLQWPPETSEYNQSFDAMISRAVDGQFGMIINFYREWKISGDNQWLEKHWKNIKRSLEYAFEYWDKDKSGVLNGFQANTFDIEFFGPNPLSMCYYLGALKSASIMAEFLGDKLKSIEYERIFEKGKQWIEENLFNGEYYIQKYESKRAKRNQMGIDCLTDQLLGLQLSRIAGLNNFLKANHIKQTLKSIFKYNFRENMIEHVNNARLYAVNDESGILVCTWPNGSKPNIPLPYATEVWIGSEYQFAVHCIMEDLVKEGLKVVKCTRSRYDGCHRNPWDEFECGHHYARAMASYGLLIALSGFKYDKCQGKLSFSPKIHQDNFKCFWALDGVWGTYLQNEKAAKIEILYGKINLKELKLQILEDLSFVIIELNDLKTKIEVRNQLITFPKQIELAEGKNLEIPIIR